MSEMTSAVETQQQQQQYVAGSSNAEHHCKDCHLTLDSEKSLEVHLRYHHENLLNQWANKGQQEESNNNHSKTGNHNSHVSANPDSVPADSSKPSSMSPSQDPTSSQQQAQQSQQQQQQQQQQSQQQPAIHTILCSPYNQFRSYNESGFMQNYMQNDPTYIAPHSYSPSQEDGQSNGRRDGYSSFLSYQHQPLFSSDRTTSNSTSPQSPPFQCDKCGVVYEDANQLGEHMRTNHLDSPTAYPSAPQYQQLGNSPQQQGQQLHPSPPLSNPPQSSYDYNGQTIKSEMKQEPPEEQAEILDLDSHKVQTHRYEEEIMRLRQQQHHHQHQQHQGLQMQIHHQQVMQQQQPHTVESLPVSSMLNWQHIQPHDYAGHPPMGPINNVPSTADQDPYMRGQHMPMEHGHQGSSMITSTQPMSGHQMPTAGFVQQTPKAPPLANQSWKSNEPRRPKTYNCTACNKWFTSSGHLKRHYNTTLHRNAVKNGKEPDPATLPITAHHHPTRENNNNVGHSTSGRGGGAPARSPPELSSRSPPNLMAGPSGEATGGLLHTPPTLCNNNSSNSSSESLAAVLVQQQQQQQLVHVGIINSPVSSPLVGHHQQQMGTAPQQLGLQQQQQQPHLPTGLSGQPVHHSTTSPTMPPPAASHMNCPSPMGLSSHPVHHMNSPPGSVHPAMTSPTAMEVTTMPHQPYPNALPPHVTVTTNTQVAPLESIQAVVTTMPLLTTGNEQDERPRHRLTLPDFRTFMPNYEDFGFVIDQNQIQAINVGGLKEEITPQESFDSSASNCDPYSPTRYKLLNNIDMTLQMNANSIKQQGQQEYVLYQTSGETVIENNNYLCLEQAKEDLDPNIGLPVKKQRKSKGSTKKQKEKIRTTNARCISRNGVHICIECNKIFGKPCYMTQHYNSFHCGDKPVKCGKCGKRFLTNEQYEKHQENHSSKRKYQCSECEKRFAHKTDLKRHSCVHTGQRPFQCKTCGKGFIRQDHMKKHMITHTKRTRQNAQRQAAQQLSDDSEVNVQPPSDPQQFNLLFNYNSITT